MPTIDEDVTAIHAFHPTQTSATAYELDFKWQDVTRLLATVRWPKPSMYSGAMKRLVQAMYGMGTVQRVAGDENSEEAAVVDFPVENTYGYAWLSTDGIHKVGETHWLIRISKTEGVLAIPLPLFECTTNDAFINAIAEIGDLDTFAVLNEFGGLPTGDNFPTGEELEIAVEGEAVLRLLSSSDVGAFFVFSGSLLGGNAIVKNGYFANCGWAFSNTGEAKEAHNTCWWYSRPDISQADWWDGGWYFDGNMDAPAEDRFMRGEHWKVTLQLPDLQNADDETVPKATIELVEMQPVEAPNCWGLDTYGFPEKMAHFKKAQTSPPSYYEADEPYWPFGTGVYPGTLDLGYGSYGGFTSPYSRFNTSSYGFEGNHGAGSTGCLPWRADVYSPPNPDAWFRSSMRSPARDF